VYDGFFFFKTHFSLKYTANFVEVDPGFMAKIRNIVVQLT
jgi:hypothetical protein